MGLDKEIASLDQKRRWLKSHKKVILPRIKESRMALVPARAKKKEKLI